MNRIRLNAISLITAFVSVTSTNVSARSALLVTHYGSSDNSTRQLTIDKITADITEAFPDLEVREAYISPIVRRNLAKSGIVKDSPVDALLKLRVEGFDTVYVQSTTIIDGIEMGEVRKSADEVAPFFSFIKVGNSLLTSPQDCQKLVDILADYPCPVNESVVYVGHGNFLVSTATYTQLDYMLDITGLTSFHVSTIEGYPSVHDTLVELSRNKKTKKVTLIPLLLVCGNHTKEDIAGDFADALREAGYKVDILMRGLAELPAVRNLYIQKVYNLIGRD